MLAEQLTAGEWAGLFSAGAAAMGVVIGAIFTGWKYIRMENNKTMLALKKIDAANFKINNSSLVKNQAETIKEQELLIAERSQEIHDLREKMQEWLYKATANEARLKVCEDQLKSTSERLNQCEDDRRAMWEALDKSGIQKPPHK